MGRPRHAARHQSDRHRGAGAARRRRWCWTWRRRSPPTARSAKAQRGEPMPVGWMVGPRGPAADRRQARRRGLSAADRRYKGYGLAHDDRAARRHAQPRRHRQGRGGHQRRRRLRHQHRATPSRRSRSTRSARPTEFKRRSTRWCANPRAPSACRGTIASSCPASRRPPSCATALPNGIPFPKPLKDSLDKVAVELGVAPL